MFQCDRNYCGERAATGRDTLNRVSMMDPLATF